MALGLAGVGVERRACTRSSPATTPWSAKATMRLGNEVTLVNVGTHGLLVRTRTRVLPGKRVELLLIADGRRCPAAGRVLRCAVVSLSPLCYEAAIALEASLELGEPVS